MTPTKARALIVLAAVMWSTSSLFTRFLSEPTFLGLDQPKLHPLQIAAFRVFFAALALVPFLRPKDICLPWGLGVTALTFASMNAMFITAMTLGPAANAILLQNAAPVWLYLASLAGFGARPDRRGALATLIGMAGIGLIVYGGWQGEQLFVVMLGIGSGIAYAIIVLGLGMMRDRSAVWMTIVNHFVAAMALVPFVWSMDLPEWRQIGWLALFGAFQMGLPYLFVAISLKQISPQESAMLCLIEPLLSPLWAWLIAPEKESPTVWIACGGACIFGALVYRYTGKQQRSSAENEEAA
jgi:drug/metabolite transporter (DMT)-like permease